jgi:hypothetical protein
VDRKGTCGTASIIVPRARATPREVQDPETIGRILAVLVPRVSIQIARVPTARTRTGRIQSVLRRTVHIPTGHMLTVPGRRGRDSMARQERAGELGVQVRTIEGLSLLLAVVLLIVEVLVVQRNRVASL